MIARKAPSSGSATSEKLEHSVAAAIGADGILHCLVFPYTTFCQLQPEGQDARVSTDQEEQLTSYEAQVDYYTNYIQSRED